MNFVELVNATIVETKRPDLGLVSTGGDGTIPQKVLAATLYCHTFDNFIKDIAYAQVNFNTLAYLQHLDTSFIPRFRKAHAMRKWDPIVYTAQGNPTILPPLFNANGFPVPLSRLLAPIEIIDVTEYLDEIYKIERQDVAYQSGSLIQIKSSTSLQYVLFYWYQYPNLGTTNGDDDSRADYSSWVAVEKPYAIIYHAASSIFSAIGRQEQSRKYDDPRTGLVPAELQALQVMNITMGGG